jgi:peptide/nickel transport system permease protein
MLHATRRTRLPLASVLPAPPVRGSLRQRGVLRSLLTLLAVALIFGVGPVLWPVSPIMQDLSVRLQGPSLQRPLGADHLGRDLLARLLHGGRLTLGMSATATTITAAMGTGLGCLAASSGGGVDLVISRVTEIMVGFPYLLLALAVAGLSGGGARGIVLALSLFGWSTYARIARAEVMRIRALPFVEAAVALGARPWRVLIRHVLPNAVPLLLVLAIARFSRTVISIAGLSFLGVGVQPPTPEWGVMLAEGRVYIERAPHLVLVPGVAVTLCCLVVSLAAEGLRRRLHPQEE